MKNSTKAMEASRVLEFVDLVCFFTFVNVLCMYLSTVRIKGIYKSFSFSWPQISSLQHQKLDFEEFVAAAINVYQLEGMDCWEQRARHAYEFFDKDGNKPIMIQELLSV